jgi:TonB family protein
LFSQSIIELKEENGMFGFFEKGKLVSSQMYDEVISEYKYNKVRIGNKWGVLNLRGEDILPTSYDTIKQQESLGYVVSFNNKFGLVDDLNNVIIPFKFEDINCIHKDNSATVKLNNKWGIWQGDSINYTHDTIVFKRPDKYGLFKICNKNNSYQENKTCADAEMLKHVFSNLKYPEKARENDIQGMVIVSFLISPEGDVCCQEVEVSADKSLDKEALKVIDSFGKWVPGVHEGVNVWSKYILPIKFRLL